jgi:hypothetical protein
MSAIEDPDSNNEPGGREQTSDDLEHWLSDLRTEVSAAPHEWINKDPGGDQPAEQPRSAGRHRAAD